MPAQIILDNVIPFEFYDQLNPDHDVLNFDYYDAQVVERKMIWKNDTLDYTHQKHIIINALKSCQRLLRAYPDDLSQVDFSAANFVTALYEIQYHKGVGDEAYINGFRSAHQIAAISEDNFVRNFPDPGNIIDKSLARRIHQKSVDIKQRVALKQAGLLDVSSSPHYSATAFNNIQGDLLQYQQALPGYEDMFGSEALIAQDDSRSTLSPAAYFVDLMHLADQYIKPTEEAELTLQFRRPDLWNIPLDKSHTYDLVPYLEIVNSVLKNNLNDRLSEEAGEAIDSCWEAAKSIYPLGLPFQLPLEKIRAYLKHFGISLGDLFQLFASNNSGIERERLNLSIEEYDLLITNDDSDAHRMELYGVKELENINKVEVFLEQTGLNATELEALLFQNVRQKSDLQTSGNRVLSFNGQNDYVVIDNFYYEKKAVINAITVEAWIKTNEAKNQVIISYDKSEYWRLEIRNNDAGHYCIKWGTTSAENEEVITDGLSGVIPVNDGLWHHIAATYEAGSGKKEIYVDGQLDIEATAHKGAPLGTQKIRYGFIGVGSEAEVAGGNTGPDLYFEGEMSDIRIWSDIRSKSDLQANKGRRLTGNEMGLECYWRLDEGAGVQLFNLVTQTYDTFTSDDSWVENIELMLSTNEYHSSLFNQFFINSRQSNNQFLSIRYVADENEASYQEISHFDAGTQDLLNRFIRLARKLDWPFADLDLVLQSIEAEELDGSKMSLLSRVKQLQEQSGWPLDELCSLWAPMRTYGIGNTNVSLSLFDKVFNDAGLHKLPEQADAIYHPVYTGNPLYQDNYLEWMVSDAGSPEDSKTRKWLQGALKVKEGDLLAIAQFLFPDFETEKVLLTVENLSLLYRFVQIPKLVGISIGEWLQLIALWHSYYDFTVNGANMVTLIEDTLELVRWMKAAGITTADWKYLSTGLADKSIKLHFTEEEAAAFLEELESSASTWLLNEDAAFEEIVRTKEQSQNIYQRLLDDRYVDSDGVLLSKYDQYTASLWLLFQLKEDSFISELISEEDAIIAYAWLLSMEYLDDQGNLMDGFNESLSFDTLFAGDDQATEKQEEIIAKLLQVQQFFSYFQLLPDSFESATITPQESEDTFYALISEGVVFENGTLNEAFDSETALSFLFQGDEDHKIAEIQLALLQRKDEMVSLGADIGVVLESYYQSQYNGILEYLSSLLGTATDITEATFWYTFEGAEVDEPLRLFLSATPVYEEQIELLAAIDRVLYMSEKMGLTANDLHSIRIHPDWFDFTQYPVSTYFSDATLNIIAEYKRLKKDLGSSNTQLLPYFEYDRNDPAKNEALATLTGWSLGQINSILNPDVDSSDWVYTADSVQQIRWMYGFFEMAGKMGVEVEFLESLYQLSGLTISTEENWNTAQGLAHDLLHSLKANYSANEWDQKFGPIREALLEKERDVLATWLIWILSEKYAQVRSLDDLYDLLLIDVKMGGCMDISYIKEAINAVQLYIHRCQMQLEADVTNKIPKDWWSWMEHYRIWEANRKVFLYPENYLDPGLRKNKSSQFKELEDELLQQPVTDEAVSKSLQHYFDKFSDLAEMKMVGSYFCKVHYPESGADEPTLFLFAASRSQQQTYYYRTLILDAVTHEVQIWKPWQKLELTIPADYLTPVYAFNKLFVFWVEAAGKQIQVGNGDNEQSAEVNKATIKYSFQKKDKSWVAPQVLEQDLIFHITPNLDGNDNDFTNAIRESVSLDLDIEKVWWKKVNLHVLPESGNSQEKLMVVFGELLRTNTTGSSVPRYHNTDEPEQNKLNNTLLETAHFIKEASTDGFTSVVPVYLMDSSLLVEQKRLIIQDHPAESSTVLSFDPGNKRLVEVSSHNLLADNFVHDLAQPGLVAYWPLNGSGEDLVGSFDGSRNGGEWQIEKGTYPHNTERQVLRVSDDKVEVKNFTPLCGADFTIECWMKADKLDAGQYIFSSEQGLSLFLEKNSGNLYLEIEYWLSGTTIQTAYFSLDNSISTSSWSHIALVFSVDGSVLRCTLYKNGVMGNTVTHVYSMLFKIPSDFRIGYNDFQGRIADMKVWSYQRTAQQIKDSYNTPVLLSNLAEAQSMLIRSKNQSQLNIIQAGKESFLAIGDQAASYQLNSEYDYEVDTKGRLILRPSDRINKAETHAFERISTSTVAKLSQKLLTGTTSYLYQPSSQFLAELPFDRLGGDSSKIVPPQTDRLDYNGANELYFWELFFHVPFFIANTLNKELKLEEAKKWYEYIFNPFTDPEPKGLVGDWVINEGNGITLYEGVDHQNGTTYEGGHAVVSADNWLEVDDFPNTPYRSVLNLTGEEGSCLQIGYFSGFPYESYTECWFKPNPSFTNGILFEYQGLVESGDLLKSFVYGVEIEQLDNLTITLRGTAKNTGININDGAWHKFGLYSRFGDVVVYIDDEEAFVHNDGNEWPPYAQLSLGKGTESPDQFIGQIAEFRMWGQDYRPTDDSKALEDENLLGYWPISEGEGNQAANLIPYTNPSVWELSTDFPGMESRPILKMAGADPILVQNFPGYPSDTFTVEGWMKVDAFTQDQEHSILALGYDFKFYHENQRLKLKLEGKKYDPDTMVDLDQWYHFALTFQKVDQGGYWAYKLYLDGSMRYDSLDSNEEIAGDYSILSRPETLAMGSNFWGSIADVHIWNVVRTDEEVWLDYNTHHSSDRFWQFYRFRNRGLQSMEEMVSNPREISTFHTDPLDPHAIARMRAGAYEKAIVMRYIDNMLDWGDYLFAQDNWEALVRATMLYLAAKNLLGTKPESIELINDPPVKSFDHLLEDASLNIPDYQLALEVQVDANEDGTSIQDLPYNTFESYFSIPENQDFLDYWSRVEDRLYKIRHCMNIDGVVRSMALFQPPIDPNQLIGALSAGSSLGSLGSVLAASVPNYRFTFMMAQAKELCTYLQTLGQKLLTALEQKDVRQLESLKAAHESAILDMSVLIREKQIEVLNENLTGLNSSLQQANERKDTYEKWINEIDEGPSGRLGSSMDTKISAISFKTAVPFLRIPAIGGYLLPNMFGFSSGGMKFGDAMELQASLAGDTVELLNMSAELAAAMAEFYGQKDELELQKSIAEKDAEQINSQIAAINLQIEIAQQELAIQQKQISQAKELEAFYKDRFTNQELYQWIAGQLSSVYFQTYQLAFDLAKAAEKAYQFELNSTESFIGFGTWDSLHKGLLSGEQLMLKLQQLQKAYVDGHNRHLEIEKKVYLSQLNPLAMEELKANGSCSFELSEQLFDLDFPGHYNRKIKTVALSVEASVGQYQNVQAMLTQNSNKIVLQPDANTIAYLLGESDATEPGGQYLRADWQNNQQIAISKAFGDHGLFELNFMDDRYLPFEGTGAVSTWTLDMPKSSNRFNFESLTDVLIHIRYTAEHGGDALKNEILNFEALNEERGFGLLSLKEVFPSEFENLIQADTPGEMAFTINENMIAFHLNLMEIGDENMDIYLLPVAQDYGSVKNLSIELNQQEWDNTTTKVSIEGFELLPSEWMITIENSNGLGALLNDIVLIVPYKGSFNAAG